jgi:arylformamidase
MLYDITLPMDARIAEWPGDTRFALARVATLEDGHSVNLSGLTVSPHTGSHVDAPFHFLPHGETVDALPLAAFLGPALVADLRGREKITIADLAGCDFAGTPRLLLKTGGWPDPAQFPKAIPVLAPEVPAWLGARGVRLLGVDLPSVDQIEDKALPNHKALAAAGIHILESLTLAAVPAGRYELIALPLKITGADAAPVRALLRTI